jgi:hypothetical protein
MASIKKKEEVIGWFLSWKDLRDFTPSNNDANRTFIETLIERANFG